MKVKRPNTHVTVKKGTKESAADGGLAGQRVPSFVYERHMNLKAAPTWRVMNPPSPVVLLTKTTPCIRVPFNTRHICTLGMVFDGDFSNVLGIKCLPFYYENMEYGTMAEKTKYIIEYSCLFKGHRERKEESWLRSMQYYVVKHLKNRKTDERILMQPTLLDALKLTQLGVLYDQPFTRFPC